MNLKTAQWRKSTHSGPNGGDCIEVAQLPDNAHWRRATGSLNNGGECVELAEHLTVVAVRDSKDPDGPVLLLTRTALRAAIASAERGLAQLKV